MTEKSLKEKHNEMWDYVINKIKAAQRMTACCTSWVPSIYRLKEEFLMHILSTRKRKFHIFVLLVRKQNELLQSCIDVTGVH